MALRRDGSLLTVPADPAATERIHTLGRRVGIGCAVVAVWGTIWFLLLVVTGGSFMDFPADATGMRLIGGVGLVVCALVGGLAVVLLSQSAALRKAPDLLRLASDGVHIYGQDAVPYADLSEVTFRRGERPTQWATTLGGTVGNEIGQQLVGVPDTMRVLTFHRRDGEPVVVDLALHLDDAEFDTLLSALESALAPARVPVRADGGPTPTP